MTNTQPRQCCNSLDDTTVQHSRSRLLHSAQKQNSSQKTTYKYKNNYIRKISSKLYLVRLCPKSYSKAVSNKALEGQLKAMDHEAATGIVKLLITLRLCRRHHFTQMMDDVRCINKCLLSVCHTSS